jgi:hypothetical protein
MIMILSRHRTVQKHACISVKISKRSEMMSSDVMTAEVEVEGPDSAGSCFPVRLDCRVCT